jgi:chromosome segregation ATPase
MTDRNLEEAIFHLQKLHTENGVKQLVEEAAQLFSKGRHMEASALMEKAEAMIAKSGPPAPAARAGSLGPAANGEKSKAEERPRADEQVMANMAGRLADGLSRILTGAFQELERHILGESRRISTSFEEQLQRLHGTVDSLTQLKTTFDQLAHSVSEQRSAGTALGQKQEQLSGAVTSLQSLTARHETEIGALRSETKDFTTVIVQQMDGFSARLGMHQDELSGLKSTVSDVSHKVAGFIERIDRQAEVIRALNENQVRRAAALDELLGVLTRLKQPAEHMVAAAAGQL